MRILHYSLGFPPYRSGGLTKFCTDLMKEQIKEGHDVALLWPGQMQLFSSRTKIRHSKDVDGIRSFEVINPTPVSYDEGIVDFKAFEAEGDKEVYKDFLDSYKPEVIHVHTFMGLHKNLLIVAKEMGIKLIFTTHDFFPICPKVTLFRNGKVCEDRDCINCPSCNITALSVNKIQILQSPVYRDLKDSNIVRKFRKQHRDEYLEGKSANKSSEDQNTTSKDYMELRDYYRSMFEQMDFIHYNSSVTKAVYDEYFGYHIGKIVFITHGDISDHRKEKHFGSHIRMAYLGNRGGGKGFFRLKAALNELWKVRQDFELSVYFQSNDMSPYIKHHDRYSYDELEGIMDNTDVVIVPSIWYETFGYTVLEALSCGVPVVVSNNVGAKDIIPLNGGIVFKDQDELIRVLMRLSADDLKAMNRAILSADSVITTEATMCAEIISYGYSK